MGQKLVVFHQRLIWASICLCPLPAWFIVIGYNVFYLIKSWSLSFSGRLLWKRCSGTTQWAPGRTLVTVRIPPGDDTILWCANSPSTQGFYIPLPLCLSFKPTHTQSTTQRTMSRKSKRALTENLVQLRGQRLNGHGWAWSLNYFTAYRGHLSWLAMMRGMGRRQGGDFCTAIAQAYLFCGFSPQVVLLDVVHQHSQGSKQPLPQSQGPNSGHGLWILARRSAWFLLHGIQEVWSPIMGLLFEAELQPFCFGGSLQPALGRFLVEYVSYLLQWARINFLR